MGSRANIAAATGVSLALGLLGLLLISVERTSTEGCRSGVPCDPQLVHPYFLGGVIIVIAGVGLGIVAGLFTIAKFSRRVAK